MILLCHSFLQPALRAVGRGSLTLPDSPTENFEGQDIEEQAEEEEERR
jgi:hypothetical protein